MSHQQADPLNAVVHEELSRLKTLDVTALAKLPDSFNQQIIVAGQEITLITWHDLLATGEHRVVAQANRRVLGGLAGFACADGFALSEDGTIRQLTNEELTAFT